MDLTSPDRVRSRSSKFRSCWPGRCAPVPGDPAMMAAAGLIKALAQPEFPQAVPPELGVWNLSGTFYSLPYLTTW
jgi:hypothetical protein